MIRGKYVFLLVLLYLCTSVLTGLSIQEAQAAKHRRFHKKRFAKAKRLKKGFREIYDEKTNRSRIIGNQMIIKFKKGTRGSSVQRFALKNNLLFINKLGKRTYVFADYSQEHLLSTLNELEESNELKNENLVDEADINEYKILKAHGRKKSKKKRARRRARKKAGKRSIQKFSLESQWHLKNIGGDSVSKAGSDINIEPAWEVTKGEGVKVAVIDTGIDTGHKDINFTNSGYSTVTGNYNAKPPFYSNENHGTAVAGLIAAKDNNKGTVGVAPKAKIIPIRMISQSGMVSSSQIIEAHLKAVALGAQIINNSWGTYDSSLEDGEQLELSKGEQDLYRDLATKANRGKGIPVIFAAGNSGSKNFNAHPEARSQYTFAVGATDSMDRRARYSVYGNELDVVAPGGQEKGIQTTDRRDLRKRRAVLGYASGSYTDTFTGTSAAAPVVAGVAALVLSVNPDLSADDIKEIIRQSARKDLNSLYKFDASGKSLEIGHGVVDAGAAVHLAQNWYQ